MSSSSIFLKIYLQNKLDVWVSEPQDTESSRAGIQGPNKPQNYLFILLHKFIYLCTHAHVCLHVGGGGAWNGQPSGVGSFLPSHVSQGSNSGQHAEHQMPSLTEPSSQSHVLKFFRGGPRVSSSHIHTSIQ